MGSLVSASFPLTLLYRTISARFGSVQLGPSRLRVIEVHPVSEGSPRKRRRKEAESSTVLSHPQSMLEDKSLDVLLLLTNWIAQNSALS